ncbi:MAG TPA: hypothetical protein VM261_27305 [Kofleriaceae bacterium]|nr:hypothetical protein [Kofleriaceae bacterium]
MRWGMAVFGVVLTLAAGVVIGLFVVKRMESGQWKMIDREDLSKVRERLGGQPRGPSRIIYLARTPVELTPGEDDAPAGASSVLAAKANAPSKLPGWKGTDKGWKQLMACVKKQWAPFNVEITDEKPAGDDYILVAVGGRPSDIGEKNKRVGGLAPFSGEVIPKAVVFAFSQQLGNQVTPVCETIGMEVAHAYGLDHGYDCKDVMTYLKPCGMKSFLDKDIACGETKKRPCAGGAATQNSYQRLMTALGPRPAPAASVTP